MKVTELIARLKQCDGNAEVQFYRHERDTFVVLSHVEPGKMRGQEVVVLGECDVKTKRALQTIPKSTDGLPDSFREIFDRARGR